MDQSKSASVVGNWSKQIPMSKLRCFYPHLRKGFAVQWADATSPLPKAQDWGRGRWAAPLKDVLEASASFRGWRDGFLKKCAAFFEDAKVRPTHRLDFDSMRVFTSAKRSTSFKAYVDYNELNMNDRLAVDATTYAFLLSHPDWYVVHSRNIVDVMCATTGRKRWSSSCYHINGVHSEEPFELLQKGGSVVYFVKEGDVKIQDPYARQLFLHTGHVDGKLFMGLCRTSSTIYSSDSSVHNLMKHVVDYFTNRKVPFNYEIVDRERNGPYTILVVNRLPAPEEAAAFFEKCAAHTTTAITSDRRFTDKLVTHLLHSAKPDLVFKIANLKPKDITREDKWSIVRWFSKENYKKVEQGVVTLVAEIFADLTAPYHRAQVRKQKQDFHRQADFYKERSHALGVNAALLEELDNQGVEVGPWVYMLRPESWEILGLTNSMTEAVHWLAERLLFQAVSKRVVCTLSGKSKVKATQALGALVCDSPHLLEEVPAEHQGYIYAGHQALDRQTIAALTSTWAHSDIVFIFAHLSSRLRYNTSKWFALLCAAAEVSYMRRAAHSTKWKRALDLMAERAPIGEEVLKLDAMNFKPTRRFLALMFHRPIYIWRDRKTASVLCRGPRFSNLQDQPYPTFVSYALWKSFGVGGMETSNPIRALGKRTLLDAPLPAELMEEFLTKDAEIFSENPGRHYSPDSLHFKIYATLQAEIAYADVWKFGNRPFLVAPHTGNDEWMAPKEWRRYKRRIALTLEMWLGAKQTPEVVRHAACVFKYYLLPCVDMSNASLQKRNDIFSKAAQNIKAARTQKARAELRREAWATLRLCDLPREPSDEELDDFFLNEREYILSK